MQADPAQSNFRFLAQHSPQLLELAFRAEYYFSSDPNTALMKLRQFGEALAQYLAADNGILFDEETTQADLLRELRSRLALDRTVMDLFHVLRKEGNNAIHQFSTSHSEAKKGLQAAWELAKWFHRSFSSQPVAIPAYQPLPDPSQNLRALQDEIAAVKEKLAEQHQELAHSRELADLMQREKDEYAALAEAMDAEARTLQTRLEQERMSEAEWQQCYQEEIEKLQQHIHKLSEEARQSQQKNLSSRIRRANSQVELSEELTRVLIDQQLNEAGWQADSKNLTHKKGARPQAGQNLAIAEYPTAHGIADYVLFSGLIPMAVVEAKKQNTDVAGKIVQAQRYARSFPLSKNLIGAWTLEGRTVAWPDEGEAHYHIPFAYSCNGRPYLEQYAEKSGTWFRDLRHPSYTRRALQQFHTPEGLKNLLQHSKQEAEQMLAAEPFGYLQLRDYQIKAIQAVEQHLAQNHRRALLAMATGTGKTRTIAGLLYRFLKSERFKRILFLVDRTALGDQATDTFKEMKMEQNQTLYQIYDIAELGRQMPEAATRVQVATVQSMVKRIFDSAETPPIDQFDCIIIDEAHRGYTLDQEMTEGELATRDAEQYLSAYRRVLDYFDAVKIALTATPAKHTSEIFGKPVFTYSYREAVADDWLIDHEPPIRYETLLTQQGIHFDKGETVELLDTHTGEIAAEELEDELDFNVEAFNRRVINENFNRVICQQLVKEIDLMGQEKTLIFCATDSHADMVKRLLDESFSEIYGSDYHQASVEKITGKSDKVDQLIRLYKNEPYPKIAITVDLLTTGIDVPAICNLVFLRRVKSRILFEQMLGRATRRCDAIGKTAFRIYDPVGIYAALENVNTMKPLVRNPNISLEQIVGEMADTETMQRAAAVSNGSGGSHADELLNQLCQKLMQVLRKAEARAAYRPAVRQQLDELEKIWNIAPKELHRKLHEMGAEKAAEFIRRHPDLAQQLDAVRNNGTDYKPVLSSHQDKLQERYQDYGNAQKPEDYLDSFNRFIQEQMSNQNIALMAAINRPRDLTREQLKELRQMLDQSGFSETKLKSAYHQQSNQDIAAGIVAHIRRAALGEAIVPFGERLDKAMRSLYGRHPEWTPAQKQWLERLKKQLMHKYETIIDRDTINEYFATDGGAKRMDKLLDNNLDQVLEELKDALWQDYA